MEPNSNPIDPFPRMEPVELRELRNALKLKTCPFCGGTVAPRWAPWLDGAPRREIEHTDIERAVRAKCPIEMGGYDSLEQLQRHGIPASPVLKHPRLPRVKTMPKRKYRLERTAFIGCHNTSYMDVDDAVPCPFCGSRQVTIHPFGQGATSYVESVPTLYFSSATCKC